MSIKTNNLQTLLDEQLKDKKFRKEWDKQEAKYQASCAIIEARKEKNLSQQELAILTGKKQSYIARIESGNQNIGISTLADIFEALGKKIIITTKDL